MQKAAAEKCTDHPCDNSRPFVRPRWCRIRAARTDFGPSMTQEADKDQTDVNAIVARFARTGQLPPARQSGVYADVTGLQGDLTDLYNRSQEMLNRVQDFANSWKPPEPAAEPIPAAPPAPTPAAT